MILTRMYLNPQRRDARRLLASPQAVHAAVLAGFPPDSDPGRVLWRVDGAGTPRTALWMVSAEEPDLAHLEEQAGWPSKPTARSVAYEGLLDALAVEQVWSFRVTVNPTHRGRRGDRQQVFAHVTAKQQTQWLLDRQERIGAALVDDSGGQTFALESREVRRFRRGDSSVTLAYATFAGTLRVVDPDALRATMVQGLGRGKAYGCGLLTLART
ncbi:type I-E CRISPR-associated protein Cas6/Cse3/CasE [Mariniluteicoccus endophyticus]